jgi:iron(III) transport system ATP-binding protein
MRDGRIVQFGRPSELYRRPVDAWVGRILGDAITLPGDVSGSLVHCALGALPLAEPVANGPAIVFLRPEQLRPAPGYPLAVNGAAQATARVLEIRFRGHEAAVDLEVPGGSVTARWASEALPALGAEVELEVVGPVLAFPPA